MPSAGRGRQILERVDDDVDVTGEQGGPDRGDEHPGAADGGQRTAIHVALGADPDEFDCTSGQGRDRVADPAGLGQRQGAAPGADPQRPIGHAGDACRMPEAARAPSATPVSAQSSAESWPAVVGFGRAQVHAAPRRADVGSPRQSPAQGSRGRPATDPLGRPDRPSEATNLGSVPGVGHPPEEQSAVSGGVGGLVIEIPDHLDVVGDETDRARRRRLVARRPDRR